MWVCVNVCWCGCGCGCLGACRHYSYVCVCVIKNTIPYSCVIRSCMIGYIDCILVNTMCRECLVYLSLYIA